MGKYKVTTTGGTYLITTEDKTPLKPISTIKTTEAPPRITEVPDIREALPEIAGATLAGLKFGAKRFPVVAAATGAGAALGEVGRQAIFEEQPLTIRERLKKVGMAGLRGALGETIGRGIGKLFTPFRRGVTPEIEAGRKAAEAVGITPPLSTITEAKVPQALTQFVKVSPFGAKLTIGDQLALKRFGETADNLAKQIAPDQPSELVGKLAEENVQNFEKTFRATKDKLYDAVIPFVKDAKPELDNTIKILKNIIERRKSLAQPSDVRVFERFLRRIEKVKEPAIPERFEIGIIPEKIAAKPEIVKEGVIKTFNDLRKFRTNITEEILPLNMTGRTGMAREYKLLRDAITRDLDNTASSVSPEIASGLKEADKFFAIGINKLKDRLIPAIQRTAQREPSKIHKLLIRKDSPELIKAGREILGKENFDDVKRQWFENLIENSKSVTEGLEVLSPQKLSNNIRRMGTTADEIFSDNPVQREAFDNLVKISNLLTRGKQITAGSQTAYLQSISSMFNVLQLPQTIATAAMSPFIRTQLGREFLTRGFPRVGKVAERIVQPTAQLGLQRFQAERTAPSLSELIGQEELSR